jgi:hypothetical protein
MARDAIFEQLDAMIRAESRAPRKFARRKRRSTKQRMDEHAADMRARNAGHVQGRRKAST